MSWAAAAGARIRNALLQFGNPVLCLQQCMALPQKLDRRSSVHRPTVYVCVDMLGWCSDLGLSPGPVNGAAGEGPAKALGPPHLPRRHSSCADTHCPAVSLQDGSIAAELLSAHEYLPPPP